MHFPTILLLSLIALSAVLIGVLVARPGATATRGGKMLAFIVLFLLPSLCMTMGVSSELERSTSTEFCLSCHVMESHGRSLYVDDPTYLTQPFITSTNFKREADGSKWKPSSCRAVTKGT